LTSNHSERSHNLKPLVCIYTNQDSNEFAIGLKEDKNFRAMTKVDEAYTKFVDAFDQIVVDENEIDWKQELNRWIAAAKKDETIFLEVDFSTWNELGERIDQ
jgi:predicted metal-dependent peptidase